jgi:UDP-glucose 4,6-dehydratase
MSQSLKWLVFGADGWIGGMVCSALAAAGQVVIRGCRVNDREDVRKCLKTHAPDRIVSCVGMTSAKSIPTIDGLEDPSTLEMCLLANLQVPVWLAQESRKDLLRNAIPLLYFGTGCIYEYERFPLTGREREFLETDPPNFFGSAYSRVKACTDQFMIRERHVLNARIRMPIADTDHPRDFVCKLLSYSKITSIPNSMSVLSDIIPILLGMTHVANCESEAWGTVNAVNPGVLDHEQVLRIFAEASGRPLHKYELEDLETQSKRLAAPRSNNSLCASKLARGAIEVLLSHRDVANMYGIRPLVTLEASLRRVASRRKAVLKGRGVPSVPSAIPLAEDLPYPPFPFPPMRVISPLPLSDSPPRVAPVDESTVVPDSLVGGIKTHGIAAILDGPGPDSDSDVYIITGGLGFIGSNYLRYALATNTKAFVLCLDKGEYCSSLHHFDDLEDDKRMRIRVILHDLSLTEGTISMVRLMIKFRVKFIYHFAAETHVDNSFGNSFRFTLSNVLGTHTLLEASKGYLSFLESKSEALRHSFRFIHMSTDEVYGEVPYGKAKEDVALAPTNPYAATKAAAEYLVQSYGESFNFPYIIVRCNNVYGPHQYPEKIIPRFIMRLRNNLPLEIQGDGSSRRNFVFVKDVVKALDAILLRGRLGEIYNIGGMNEYSVIDVARLVSQAYGRYVRALGKDFPEILSLSFVADRPFNDCRYSVNDDKLYELNYLPNHSFHRGLAETVEWYCSKELDYWMDGSVFYTNK